VIWILSINYKSPANEIIIYNIEILCS
jgi:hypothetical protein